MIPFFQQDQARTFPGPHALKSCVSLWLSLVFFFPMPLDSSVHLPGLLADVSNFQEIRQLQKMVAPHDPAPDHRLAALTIYMEAKGESFAGKLAVAAVIRNRMLLKYQSDGTIKGTVLRRKQFQPWNTRQPHQVKVNMKDTRMKDSLLAWRLVQDGRNIVDGAVLFFNPRMVETPKWAAVGHKVATIGRHDFYRPRKQHT